MSDLTRKIEQKISKVNEMLQKARLLEGVIEELAARVNAVYFAMQEMQKHAAENMLNPVSEGEKTDADA